MVEIECGKTDCVFNGLYNCTCKFLEIDEFGKCSDFESYKDYPEYQNEYYVAIKIDCDGKHVGKLLKKGKKILINGELFYTSDSPSVKESKMELTHARTGYLLRYEEIKDNFGSFFKCQEKLKSVDEYEEVVWDEKNDKYIFKEGKK